MHSYGFTGSHDNRESHQQGKKNLCYFFFILQCNSENNMLSFLCLRLDIFGRVLQCCDFFIIIFFGVGEGIFSVFMPS
uniref:Uncharacterized protein n=1 Tax=Anguilla anguilla TaxID=7936 RepID=A0A0E9X4M6_ANGAN